MPVTRASLLAPPIMCAALLAAHAAWHDERGTFAHIEAAEGRLVSQRGAQRSAAGQVQPTREQTPLLYFPPADADGGWRALIDADQIRRVGGIDKNKLDEAFAYVKGSTKHGGLLVLRRGWLVYEEYFGLGDREATPNLASVGKSFTSIAVGILLGQRPDRFPNGLDQEVFTPGFLPPETFPLTDPRMAKIKLGQLLAMTAGIRGNNPVYVLGKERTIDPAGPDGAPAATDAVALGKDDVENQGRRYSTRTLWCQPGDGYSYATSSIHLASMVLRHVTGMETALRTTLMMVIESIVERPGLRLR